MVNKNGADCALKLDNIIKKYGAGNNVVDALKGVSLNFRKSEFVSVLGPSGCGKTTLLNIIGGLDRYTSGDLIIKGKSTKEYKDSDWDTYRNNSIGFVFQSYNLIPHQTVISNVELALTLSGVNKAERRKRAEEVLEKVGLKGLENKKPNQMSGGQMQRVAIARALINNPEIILADEPTGALDTETSVQIMELLKEVAKDRLVIMVTHNPDLAEKYSTRIIRLLDGKKVDDTDPFEPEKSEKERQENKKGKAAMRIWTAFALSFSNLLTKKGRTILTSVAGSIGIIGIALVLAVSTGFSGYVSKLQADTLSVYPLTVSEATIDLSDFQNLANRTISDETVRQRVEQKVFARAMFGDLTNMLKSNNINQEYEKKDGTKIKYLDYVESYIDSENEKAAETETGWAYALKKGYGFDVNNYIFSDIGYNLLKSGDVNHNVMSIDALVRTLETMFNDGMKNSNMNISAEFVRSYIPTLSEMPDNRKLLESQYEIIDEGGRWAENENELMLVVDRYNRISDITLALLGITDIKGFDKDTYSVVFGDEKEFSFKDIKKKEFYYIDNTERYSYNSYADAYMEKLYAPKGETASAPVSDFPEGKAQTLTITGIIRLKDGVDDGVLTTGIAYSSAFVQKILNDENNLNSPVVAAAAASENNTAKVYQTLTASTTPKEMNIREFGADKSVSKLSIYSAGYEEKENMKIYLDKWNTDVVEKGETEEEKTAAKEAEIHYSDSTEMLFSAMNSIVEAVSIVLVVFTSISLVVSSIMIGIITYVSVVERTKEIGVLRAIGARKKDISRIFNAETFLIGLFAGLFGIIVTYLLSIPINIIVGMFLSGIGAIASLKITHAIILVVISFALTLIAGIVPSRIAAKKDPVVALRSE